MADNVTLNAGTGGETLATDQVAGGEHYQLIKLAFGALDTATIVSTSNGLPVDLRASNASQAVTNGGTFATQATLQAGTAEVGKLAAGVAEIGNVKNSGTFAVQSDTTLQAETTKVIGTVNMAAAQTIATTNAGTFAVQVDAALPAGTNAIGKLAANTGVDIGDVDVTSSALPTGAATSANQVAKATGGMSFHMLALAAEDNDAVIKASAATVYFISVQSIDATPVYLKLFNQASFTPGTDTADLQFMCPSQGDTNGSGITLNFGDHGIQFGTGLCALIATGIALDNNTAVSANEVVVTIGYE